MRPGSGRVSFWKSLRALSRHGCYACRLGQRVPVEESPCMPCVIRYMPAAVSWPRRHSRVLSSGYNDTHAHTQVASPPTHTKSHTRHVFCLWCSCYLVHASTLKEDISDRFLCPSGPHTHRLTYYTYTRQATYKTLGFLVVFISYSSSQ